MQNQPIEAARAAGTTGGGGGGTGGGTGGGGGGGGGVVTPPVIGDKLTAGASLGACNTRWGWTSVHNQTRSSTTKAWIGAASTIQNQHLIGFGSNVDPEVRVLNRSLTSNVVTLDITSATGWEIGDPLDVVGVGAPFDGSYTITVVTPANFVDSTGKTVHPVRTAVSYAKTNANVAFGGVSSGAVARNWSFMDQTFGFPTGSSGYFSSAAERCLTIMGCPIYMKSPKSGQPYDPIGTHSGVSPALTSLSNYTPPHSSWFQEYADLIAAFASRYPHVKYFQVWNELKGFFVGTQYAGSNAVPTGSGLPAGFTSLSNRWWYEGYTAMFNKIYTAVKAVRPDAVIVGPYAVLRAYSWTSSGDWANDALPYNQSGAWGYTDKKILDTFLYMARNATGLDMMCFDWRNLMQDGSVGGFYSIPSVPGTPDPTNQWTTNADGGHHHQFWLEGQTVGAWNQGQRFIDFMTWLRAVGESSSVYQRPVADLRTIDVCIAEYYAYGSRPQFKAADPHTGDYYVETTSSHAEETAAMAWQSYYMLKARIYYGMCWKPEGSVQGNVVDDGDSNPLALYRQNAPAGGTTELYPMMVSMVAAFTPGLALTDYTSTLPEIKGIATPNKLMVISRSPSPTKITVVDPDKATDGLVLNLAAYEVRFLDRNIVNNTGPSGFSMPLADPAGMTRVFQDDFSTYGTVPIGSFPSATGGRWGGYGSGATDTSGNGTYDSTKTVSITGGVLDIKVWSEMISSAQVTHVAAPWPIIPGNQPTGVIPNLYGFDYTGTSVRANIYYGQIEFAFRCSTNAPKFKTAWLLWPDEGGSWPRNGEIDFPEGNLDGTGTIHAFHHRQDATVGSDQDSRDTGVVYADASHTWHKAKIIWKPNFLEFYLDDVKQGATITSRVDKTPMHWIFQTETQLSGGPPDLATVGHMQVDWIVMHQLDGY